MRSTLSQMAFYFYRVLINFVSHCKRVHKRDHVLSLGNIILNTVVWKEISNDYTAIISFKLITF